jgi:hypothetical protein
MNEPLTSIYQDTLHAQCALIRLSALCGSTTDTLADWNAVEEELTSALERFTAHRQQRGPMNLPKHASPGLAGGLQGPIPAPAASEARPLPAPRSEGASSIYPIPPISTPLS